MNKSEHACDWGDPAMQDEFLACRYCGAPHPSITASIASARQTLFEEMFKVIARYGGKRAFSMGITPKELQQIVDLMEEFEEIADKHGIDIDEE